MAQITDKRVILLVTCMTAFITPFLASSVNIALPAINADFRVPDQALLGWVVTGFLLSAAIFVVPLGRIADMFGRKTIFVMGLSIVVISSLLCSISTSVEMLIASRVVEGLGSAMIFGTAFAILTAAYPVKERGKVLGINLGVTFFALSGGPFLGGMITQYIGWRAIYSGIMVYTFIVAALALLMVKENERCAEAEKFDMAGAALYAAMLFFVIVGLTLIPDIGGALLIALGIVIMAIFFRWELGIKNPVLKVSTFRSNSVFAFSNLAALINYSATFGVAYLLTWYLQYIRGYEPQTAGLILIAQPVMQALFSPLTGRLSDKIEPRIIASAGMGLCVIGLALLALLTPETPIILIIASLILLGLGFALFVSPNTNAIMSSVERCDYGVASGMVSTMRLIGQMISVGIAMLTFSVIIGHTGISAGDTGNLMPAIGVAFAIFAALCIIGTIFSMAGGNLRKETIKVPAMAQHK